MNMDEAIKHAKEKATEKYNEAMLCHANPDDGELDGCIECAREHEQLAEWLIQLKKYQQLEEQGRLIKLPCKVGDTVWVVTSPFNVFDDAEYDENIKDEVYEGYVSSITFYNDRNQYRIYAKETNRFIGAYLRECDFRKTVFLTKSEAEAKLEELRGNNE